MILSKPFKFAKVLSRNSTGSTNSSYSIFSNYRLTSSSLVRSLILLVSLKYSLRVVLIFVGLLLGVELLAIARGAQIDLTPALPTYLKIKALKENQFLCNACECL